MSRGVPLDQSSYAIIEVIEARIRPAVSGFARITQGRIGDGVGVHSQEAPGIRMTLPLGGSLWKALSLEGIQDDSRVNAAMRGTFGG